MIQEKPNKNRMRLKSRWWRILILRESAGFVAGITHAGLGDENIDFRQKITSAELEDLESETNTK